jgi:DNA polymerase-3 subunit epsilon
VDGLLAFLEGCDRAGFGLKRFDLRVLSREASRAGRRLPLEGRALIDVLDVYHHKERRHLAAAVRFYMDREHLRGHFASADAQVADRVFGPR